MDGKLSQSFRSHNKAWEYAVQHKLEDGEGLCLARPSAEYLVSFFGLCLGAGSAATGACLQVPSRRPSEGMSMRVPWLSDAGGDFVSRSTRTSPWKPPLENL